jgi:hypothetical protein
MGAWNEEPLGNDIAHEWLANSIAAPAMDAICAALRRFLAEAGDDAKKAEAEAAVALLIDLVGIKGRSKYADFDAGYMASQVGVWQDAIATIKLLRSDTTWLANWNYPDNKARVLDQLLADLDVASKVELPPPTPQ